MKPQLNQKGETSVSIGQKNFATREGQIEMAKKIGPVMCAIFEKIASSFDGQSRLDLPNGKALSYYIHDELGVTYRCGAQMKVSIPYEFIEQIDEGTVQKIDHMIRDWIFLFNGIDIPPQLWCDNPHYNATTHAAEVPKNVDKVLSHRHKAQTKTGRLVDKLLPPRISQVESEDTSDRGVPKLRQVEFVKFPLLFIKKREIS